MADGITRIDPASGLVAVSVTAVLVLLASYGGLPVSTTHVSVGALFGLALVNGTARMRTVGSILLAWVTTLPLAAVLSAGLYTVLAAPR
jgi:PiT family inorganic phosphate transporter